MNVNGLPVYNKAPSASRLSVRPSVHLVFGGSTSVEKGKEISFKFLLPNLTMSSYLGQCLHHNQRNQQSESQTFVLQSGFLVMRIFMEYLIDAGVCNSVWVPRWGMVDVIMVAADVVLADFPYSSGGVLALVLSFSPSNLFMDLISLSL
uniref:Uncharacterized protein n=1 Tax=Stomoxys calcitrans TaxID=35570 RepID=A0A1I8NVD2_STOCA